MSNNISTIETLQRLEKKIDSLGMNLLNQKTVLTFHEAARYTGFSRSYLYKLTSLQKIPCHKPAGKMLFFDRAELENWLLRNQVEKEEIEVRPRLIAHSIRKEGGHDPH